MKAEVRGHRGSWKVFYEDESGLPSTHLVYDRDGTLKGTVEAGNPTDKLVEAHHVSPTRDEAESYARYLGADEVTFVTVKAQAPRAPRKTVPKWKQL